MGESSEEKDERIPRVFSFVPMKKRQNVWYIRDYLLSLQRAIYEARHLYLLKSRKNMKKLTLLLTFLLTALAGQAQSVNVYKTNGEVLSIPMTEVNYIDFSEKDETVSPPEGVEAVNLGLPSGTKWANMNVGATKPEEYGGYYAWGETMEKSMYTSDTYLYYTNQGGTSVKGDIAFTNYDVAFIRWGGYWHMPNREQWKELMENSDVRWTQVNGVYGSKFTSKINGKSIFLPAGGNRKYNAIDDSGSIGYYWSSYANSFSLLYMFDKKERSWLVAVENYKMEYFVGASVRPVIK